MSEVHHAERAAAQADERRQVEKSDAEKAQSRASFEKRLNQDRGQKEDVRKQTHQQAQARGHAQEAKTHQGQNAERAQNAAREEKTGKPDKKDGEKKAAEQGRENGVLAHVRQQAAQQGQPKTVDKRLAGAHQEAAAMLGREMEHAATQSGDQKASLNGKRQDGLGASRAQEKGRTREMDDKERIKEKDTDVQKSEEKREAQQAGQPQPGQNVQGGPGGAKVDADGQRQQQNQQQRQGGGGQPATEEAQATKGPSQGAIARANKAQEIQKLCEKLLDNFYLGCAPDGSAMMRMEMKEGVLAGLVIDLKVDDKRRVSLTLSGGNKEAIDFVTSSRGELARALGRKGLELSEVKSA
jgi:hypothetical protein